MKYLFAFILLCCVGCSQTQFIYNDRVIVIQGFYRGTEGKVKSNFWALNDVVYIKTDDGEVVWIHINWLLPIREEEE